MENKMKVKEIIVKLHPETDKLITDLGGGLHHHSSYITALLKAASTDEMAYFHARMNAKWKVVDDVGLIEVKLKLYPDVIDLLNRQSGGGGQNHTNYITALVILASQMPAIFHMQHIKPTISAPRPLRSLKMKGFNPMDRNNPRKSKSPRWRAVD